MSLTPEIPGPTSEALAAPAAQETPPAYVERCSRQLWIPPGTWVECGFRTAPAGSQDEAQQLLSLHQATRH